MGWCLGVEGLSEKEEWLMDMATVWWLWGGGVHKGDKWKENTIKSFLKKKNWYEGIRRIIYVYMTVIKNYNKNSVEDDGSNSSTKISKKTSLVWGVKVGGRE